MAIPPSLRVRFPSLRTGLQLIDDHVRMSSTGSVPRADILSAKVLRTEIQIQINDNHRARIGKSHNWLSRATERRSNLL